MCTHVHIGSQNRLPQSQEVHNVASYNSSPFSKDLSLSLEEVNVHFQGNENQMFGYIYSYSSSFSSEEDGRWLNKIFGDFQMRLNISFTLLKRKISLLMGTGSQHSKCFYLAIKAWICSEWASSLARDSLSFMRLNQLSSSMFLTKDRMAWFMIKFLIIDCYIYKI